MKFSKFTVAVLSGLLLTAPVVWSQQGQLSDELERELANETQGEVIEVQDLSQSAPAARTQYRSRQARVQQQPTTYVQASPMEESRAEQLRRQRQDAELATEQKIVEKLESSRLDDEKRRADALFGDRLNTMNGEQQQAPVNENPYNNPAAWAQNQQAVVVPTETEKEEADIKGEVAEAVREELKAIKEEDNVEEDRYYITAAIGGSEYPDEPNVSSNSAFGVGFGVEMPNSQMVLEGTFIYSDYFVRENRFFGYKFSELEQYNFDFAVKYSILTGRVRPVAGAVIGYVHRKYKDIQPLYYNRFRNADTSTDSFDIGAIVGLDLEVTDRFLVGIDFRYMTNITSRSDSDFFRAEFFNYRTPVEEMNYYNFGINGKVRF